MTAIPDTARHLSLDVIRGVAVMGILVANLPAFALPEAAYFSPLAWGGTAPADIAAWFATFVLVEGKLRGLFACLFGASMLLVAERAEAAGRSAAGTHYARMAMLFAIGVAHLYLVWWGDILSHYALVGSLVFLVRRLPVHSLAALALLMVAWQLVWAAGGLLLMIDAAARDTPGRIETWAAFAGAFGVPPRGDLIAEIAATRAGWMTETAWRWHEALDPLSALPVLGPETAAAMLLGMIGYRTGFLTGAWSRRRYRRIAIVCVPLAWAGYAALGWSTMAHGFDPRRVYAAALLFSVPLRLVAVAGYAAALILLAQPDGWLTRRVAAVGRAAFTNYLGTSVAVTFVFYGWGWGQFGIWSRAQLYWLAPPVWAIMLAWSAPWLARHRFGPLEAAWRRAAAALQRG